MQPKYDVFISHANEDSEKSIELYNALKAENISCWLDKISGIVDYTLDIPTAVESSLILILLASKSANRPRGGVITECTIALDREVDVPIHSILIEDVQLIELRNLRYFLSSPVERLHAFSHTQAKPVQEIARVIASRVSQIKSENAFVEDISTINQQEVKSTSVVVRAKQPKKSTALPTDQSKPAPQVSEAQLTVKQANEQLKEALALGRNPNKGKYILAAIHSGANNFLLTDNLGRTALHWAAMKGDTEAIKTVLAGDPDVNALTQDEKTPLDLAAEKGFKEAVALLANAQLQSALSLGQGRSKGESKNERILRAIRSGATDFSLIDQSGRTALHWAAIKDDVQAARIALAGGVDANAVNNLGQTALKLAKANNASKVIALLSGPVKATTLKATPQKSTQAEATATPPTATKPSSPEKTKATPPTTTETTSLSRLAQIEVNNELESALNSSGGRKVQRIFDAIKAGSTNVSHKGYNDFTALHWAALKDELFIAKMILERGADPNPIAGSGDTPLHMAVKNKSLKMIGLLMDFGARSTVQGAAWQETAIERAGSNFDIVTLMLDKGDDPNCGGVAEGSLLHSAVLSQGVELVKLLVERGANPDYEVKGVGTALDFAKSHFERGYRAQEKIDFLESCTQPKKEEKMPPRVVNEKADAQFVSILESTSRVKVEKLFGATKQGATNLDARDKNGRTALHWAAKESNLEFTLFLLKSKVDVNAIAAKAGNETALHIAVENGGYEIAEFLMKFGADYTIARNPWSKLPMHIALDKDDAKMVAVLLNNGVDVNDTSSMWGTYLQIADSASASKSRKVLVAHKAKLDAS